MEIEPSNQEVIGHGYQSLEDPDYLAIEEAMRSLPENERPDVVPPADLMKGKTGQDLLLCIVTFIKEGNNVPPEELIDNLFGEGIYEKSKLA
jgi:hypothetical protein